MGRLEAQKGHDDLLSATAQLRSRRSGFRLLVAGDGPLREPLRKAAAGKGLEDVVSWLGVRPDVPDLLMLSDAFVLSSRWEGSPNVVLEALAAEVPVAATDVGGVRDIVRSGVTGFLTTPGDAAALASIMERVMDLSNGQRRLMGACGRRSIQATHDSAVVLAQWERLLSTAWNASRTRLG